MSTAPQHPTRDEWLTWPNAITVARFLLIGPVCWLLITAAPGNPWPLVLLAVWASTDWVDGVLARRLDQRTRTGEILDPIADRLGTVAILVSLAVVGLVPWAALIAIAGTDLIVLLGAGRAAARGDIHVSRLGKVRTAVLFAAVIALVLAATLVPALAVLGEWLLWIGTAMHVLVGIGYLVAARRPRRA
ncbi:MAG: CDP-alcohol phosphatidyltransferase family protein [Microbacteriaceae bacterium]|nr:CDP-alcohol phosphatidyltransferase family protein [Microbacteriaceae bacterium]